MLRTSPTHRSHRRWALALVVGAMLTAGAVAGAQPPAGPPPGGPPAAGPGAGPRGHLLTPEGIDRHVQALTERVHLNARQQRQARQILESAAQEARALRASGGPRSPETHRARRDLMFRVEDQIWALLTCEQKDAYRLFQREMRARRMDARMAYGGRGHGHHHGHGRGRGPGGGAGPGPGAGRGPGVGTCPNPDCPFQPAPAEAAPASPPAASPAGGSANPAPSTGNAR